eukprot:Gb_27037 [translate_table: standard]
MAKDVLRLILTYNWSLGKVLDIIAMTKMEFKYRGLLETSEKNTPCRYTYRIAERFWWELHLCWTLNCSQWDEESRLPLSFIHDFAYGTLNEPFLHESTCYFTRDGLSKTMYSFLIARVLYSAGYYVKGLGSNSNVQANSMSAAFRARAIAPTHTDALLDTHEKREKSLGGSSHPPQPKLEHRHPSYLVFILQHLSVVPMTTVEIEKMNTPEHSPAEPLHQSTPLPPIPVAPIPCSIHPKDSEYHYSNHQESEERPVLLDYPITLMNQEGVSYFTAGLLLLRRLLGCFQRKRNIAEKMFDCISVTSGLP